MGETELTQAEVSKHLNVMCGNIFENLGLYIGRLTKDPSKRYSIAEVVLVNVLAKHVVAITSQMQWQDEFLTEEDFQDDFLKHIKGKLTEAIEYMRSQR